MPKPKFGPVHEHWHTSGSHSTSQCRNWAIVMIMEEWAFGASSCLNCTVPCCKDAEPAALGSWLEYNSCLSLAGLTRGDNSYFFTFVLSEHPYFKSHDCNSLQQQNERRREVQQQNSVAASVTAFPALWHRAERCHRGLSLCSRMCRWATVGWVTGSPTAKLCDGPRAHWLRYCFGGGVRLGDAVKLIFILHPPALADQPTASQHTQQSTFSLKWLFFVRFLLIKA